MMSRYITILSFGEEIAIGLGQNTTLIKFIGTVLVLVLTGSAVSMAGSGWICWSCNSAYDSFSCRLGL